jgi:lycopene beta-cyclase
VSASASGAKHFDADVIVVGAGLSGLSVTVALLDAGLPADARVLLIDPRAELDGHDRTWCFFDVAPHAFTEAVAHRWSRWHVRCGGRELLLAHPDLTYCHIPGARFYEVARARLAQAGDRIALRLGAQATRIDDHGDHVVVHTHEGPLRAKLAFDSRPPPLAGARLDDKSVGPADGHVRLLQHFRGRIVRTRAPVFDAGLATLMDFDVDQHHGIHFVYVLPFDAHTALVESTFFTPRVLRDEIYERAIDDWLAARKPGHAFETVSREHGVIPMTTEPFDAHPSPRVVRIGTAGGAAKPSTGYAFLAVQRFARAFAPRVLRALREGGVAAPPEVRSARTTALDTVFLSYLARHPARAPRNFFHLFERVPPELLVRFLSDGSSVADDLRVMRAGDIPRLSIETARTAPLLRRLGR